MIADFWMTNLVPYSLQLGVVIAITGVALTIMRVRSPRARLLAWRVVLATALLLPLQPWRVVSGDGQTAIEQANRLARDPAVGSTGEARRDASGAAATSRPVVATLADLATQVTGWTTGLSAWTSAWGNAIASFLVAGTVARLLWLAIGWWRLRRTLPHHGADGADDVAHDGGHHGGLDAAHDVVAAVARWQQTLGTSARVEWRPEISQPITFGAWPPVILLPTRLATLSADMQKAVICHELLHVRQRDWLWVVGEEVVRAVLWFHPAMWWLLDQLQAAREELIDRLTLRATGQRRPYLEALLAFAAEPAAPSRGPAAAFFRSRHLARRIASLMTEVQMSSRQRFATGLVLGLSFTVSLVAGIAAFPLQSPDFGSSRMTMTVWPHSEPGPLERQARQLGSAQSAPARVVDAPVEFPADLIGQAARGIVVARIVLDAAGDVAEARVLTLGVDRQSEGAGAGNTAAGAALSDDDMRARLGERTLATIRQWRYEPIEQAPLAMTVSVYYNAEGPDRQAGGLLADNAAPGITQTVSVLPSNGVAGGIGRGVPGGVSGGVAGGVAGGVSGGMAGGVAGRVAGGVSDGAAGGVVGASTRRGDGTARGERPVAALRVGGNISAPRKTFNVAPIYPADARAAGVHGVVILETEVDEDGNVSRMRVLRSVPGLDQAALDAVGQWQYEPTLVEGIAVPVVMTVTIGFSPE